MAVGQQILAVAKLAHRDALSKDAVVNTFAFNFAAPPSGSALSDLIDDVVGFYGDTQASGFAVGGLIGPCMDRGAAASLVELYDISGSLSGGPHGSPVAMGTFPLPPAASGNPLPSECAIALSYFGSQTGFLELGPVAAIPSDEAAVDEGAPATHTGVTKPKSRRRGRIFIGPLDRIVLDTDSNNRARVGAQFRTTIAQAARALINDASYTWGVWSRRNASIVPIVGAYVDDAFDTQRRRGEARQLFTLA